MLLPSSHFQGFTTSPSAPGGNYHHPKRSIIRLQKTSSRATVTVGTSGNTYVLKYRNCKQQFICRPTAFRRGCSETVTRGASTYRKSLHSIRQLGYSSSSLVLAPLDFHTVVYISARLIISKVEHRNLTRSYKGCTLGVPCVHTVFISPVPSSLSSFLQLT